MKELCAHFISADITAKSLAYSSSWFDGFEKQSIDNLLWSVNDYRPEASFVLAYTSNSILIKYSVKEEHTRAVYRKTNDPVYKDSCVEAFIAFDDKGYYNLEFNCLGTALIGYGAGKNDRVNVNNRLVEAIKAHHSIKSVASDGLIKWELTLNIPFNVFEYHSISSLNDHAIKANFYKCGDELPEPHFLSWNNIIHPEPNFHLPQFFGTVKFVS